MKIECFVLLHLIFAASSDVLQKCCEPSEVIVDKNSTLQCDPNAGKRLQTNFVQNQTVSNNTDTLCVDVFAENKMVMFYVDQYGTIEKKMELEDEYYPKCCQLGHIYNDKLHSCQPANITSSTETTIPLNSFILVGLPQCEVIVDFFVSDLKEVAWPTRILHVKGESRSFDGKKFCVDDTVSGSRYVVRICESLDVCDRIRCIHKCCPDGQSFVNGSKCVDTFRYGIDLHSSANIEEPDAPFALIHGKPKSIYRLKNIDFKIDKSGTFSVYRNATGSYSHYKSSEQMYCFEHAKKGRINGYNFFAKVPQLKLKMKFVITRWLKILSCIFLLLTIAVYLILPKMLNLFGKILLSYSLATFMFFFLLCLTDFLNEKYDDSTCKTMGFLSILASFWSFTWLNVMCIDIWLSFGTPRTFSGPLQRNELKRLIQYSVYAWGIPLIWVFIIVIFNSTAILSKAFHPHIGDKKCYMENTGDHPENYGYFTFIVVPMLIQQIGNIILFVKTLIHCLRIKGEIQRMNASSKKNYKVGKEELHLVMKLAVIMGVSFLFETVSSVYNFNKNSVTRNIEIVWDSINCLQGFFIFVVFICKKKIFYSLAERLNIRTPSKNDGTSSIATQESTHGNTIKRDTISLR
ncbi:probable G-protein coupled receptor Mth-like 3 isoform X2 [Harmonia axyridis]|uniref:probable G-protein coupled receptor Mth-like 3 isoform X2 n=1 Tax=Harmonia axyridis TaxID=115357 RepID=UPI001E2764F6|nr:probable G-protein coupled receptor Mth-like 3 isoform X2 [Harmonia axyridis]